MGQTLPDQSLIVNRSGEYNVAMGSHMERHAALRAKKQDIANRLLQISTDKRGATPSDGGFGPAELMEHLAIAEEFNLKFLRKVGPKQIAARRVKPGPMYKMILGSFLNLKRVSAPPMLKPSKTPDMEAQHAIWMKRLDEVDSFLSQVSTSDAPFIKMNFLFGTLSADHFLEFQEAHIKYHDHYFPQV